MDEPGFLPFVLTQWLTDNLPTGVNASGLPGRASSRGSRSGCRCRSRHCDHPPTRQRRVRRKRCSRTAGTCPPRRSRLRTARRRSYRPRRAWRLEGCPNRIRAESTQKTSAPLPICTFSTQICESVPSGTIGNPASPHWRAPAELNFCPETPFSHLVGILFRPEQEGFLRGRIVGS